MIYEYLGWILSFLSIIGAIINAFGNRWGFIVWVVSNIGWIIFSVYEGIYSQIPLWILYTITSIYGFYHWTKKLKEENKND